MSLLVLLQQPQLTPQKTTLIKTHTLFTFALQNPGYYDIKAQDVSVWHVPNNEEQGAWSNTSILRYHTETHFLADHGGNLYHLFKVQTLTPSGMMGA